MSSYLYQYRNVAMRYKKTTLTKIKGILLAIANCLTLMTYICSIVDQRGLIKA